MPGEVETHKIVVLGDGAVGKTALVMQASLNQFMDTFDPTIEDTYIKRTIVDGIPCLIEITDTGGQAEFSPLREAWIRGGEAFVICYSISSRDSFTQVKCLFRQIVQVMDTDRDFDTHLVTIVGNKSDRVTERTVSPLEGLSLANELRCGFVEASAKMDKNVEPIFTDLVRLRRQRRLDQSADKIEGSRNTPYLYKRRRTFFGSSQIIIPPDEYSTPAGRQRLAASLIKAAQTNNEALVTALIKCGIDVNHQTIDDGSALHSASAAGHVNIVNILIKKGAAINSRKAAGPTPLQLASAEGHLAVVRLLLHKGALINQTCDSHGTALSAAASRGRTDVAVHLLKRQANVDIVGGPYGTALHAACWNGDTQLVVHLLNAGANIRSRGNKDCTVLQMAAFAGHASVVQCLLDRGAKVDIDAPGSKYGSAFKAAHDHGNYSAMKVLLDAGAATGEIQAPRTPDMGTTRTQSNLSETTTCDVGEEKIPADMDHRMWFSSTTLPPLNLSVGGENKPLPQPPRISDLGFSTVQSPATATVDIVFVHGLQGHPERSWTYSESYQRQAPRRSIKEVLLRRSSSRLVVQDTPADPVFWPRDLLAASGDFADSRILLWGYDTQVVGHFFGANDQQNISQHGHNLLVALQQERKEDPHRPLLFVAHSLGGIIVKVALGNSRGSRHQPQFLSIYESTRGIVFLGTPHGGSQTANWGLVASNIIKCALQDPAESVLRGLRPNNELLENLQKTFLEMLEDGHFGVHSFYETKAMMGIYGINGMVVPYESALVGHARKEVVAGIHANHSEICKFRDRYDHGFKVVSGALQDYITVCSAPKSA
ncbi:putative RAS-2 protein [Rosellinia necatrix]|uniref:Putative RAS-2 protein n=1 Tax=Rosellinia necatrix TaxID=77044 RepID=A0A1W2TUH1_ROSNE|nr:putative RAS-2 protein [Rosellinia necatrix]